MKKIIVLFSSVLLLAACNSETNKPADTSESSSSAMDSLKSKEERNKQVIKESLAAMNNHDIDGVLKNADVNSVDYGEGSGHVVKGIDSIKAGMQMWLNAIPDYKGENFEYFTDGSNKVLVYGDWSGTFKNDMMGMKATGKTFKVKDADLFTLNDDGKITEHRSVQSMATIMQQVSGKGK